MGYINPKKALSHNELRATLNKYRGFIVELDNGTLYKLNCASGSFAYLTNSNSLDVQTSINAISKIYPYNKFPRGYSIENITKIDKYERSIKVCTGNPKVRKRTRIRRASVSCRTGRARCKRSNF